MSAVIALDGKLDYQAVAPLVAQLTAAPAGDLVFAAGHVTHLGAQALQVIIAVIRSRAAAGATCQMRDTTDACVDQLALFGFTPESLCAMGAPS